MAGRKKGSFKLKVGDKVTNKEQNRDGVIVHVRNLPIKIKGWENKTPPFYEVHWMDRNKREKNRTCEVFDNLVKVMPKTREIVKDTQD